VTQPQSSRSNGIDAHEPAVPFQETTTEAQSTPQREQCGACGQFLRKDSLYTNRCSNCWGPEDEFLW
jgi:hypothetical protein